MICDEYRIVCCQKLTLNMGVGSKILLVRWRRALRTCKMTLYHAHAHVINYAIDMLFLVVSSASGGTSAIIARTQ